MADDKESVTLKEAAQQELDKQVEELKHQLKLSPEDVKTLMQRIPDVDTIMKELTEKLRNIPSQGETAIKDSAEIGGLEIDVEGIPGFNVNDPEVEIETDINGKKHCRLRAEPFIDLIQAEEKKQMIMEDPDIIKAETESFADSAKKKPTNKTFVELIEGGSRDKGSFPRPPLGGSSKPG